jgi:CRISPR-associated protein Cas1
MPNLYITEQGARLERLSQRLVVRKNNERLLEVPVKDVERVLIFGSVQVTTQAFSLLLEKGIDVNLLSIHGRFRGKLCPGLSKNIQLRLAQHGRLQDEKFRLVFAANVVEAKIRNQQAILKRYMRNHSELDFNHELASITNALKLLPHQSNLDSVRAVEGMATAAYFSAFSGMARSEPVFAKRSKRPPADPVNGLLSLGYTLVSGEVAGILEAHGLDPFMGFYHTAKHGRQSLALDMLEEFRHPLVDRFTLKTLNTRALDEDDFEIQNGKRAYLKDESFKRYIGLYEGYLAQRFFVRKLRKQLSFRDLFRIQAENLARVVKSGGEYEPFIVE